jgi:hypothetical protein
VVPHEHDHKLADNKDLKTIASAEIFWTKCVKFLRQIAGYSTEITTPAGGIDDTEWDGGEYERQKGCGKQHHPIFKNLGPLFADYRVYLVHWRSLFLIDK